MSGIRVPALDGMLRSCCRAAGLDGAGVSVVSSSGTHEPLYGSDDIADRIEHLQVTLGEGPCIDALATRSPVLVADLTDPRDAVASRWPVFQNEATRTGARAVFAFPIQIGAISLGAVDLYRRTAGPLSQPELSSALASVDAVALALLEGPDYHGDGPALLDMTVHRAAGMVMSQLDSSIEEAMVRLRAAAFADGLPLNELALDVVNHRRRFSKET